MPDAAAVPSGAVSKDEFVAVHGGDYGLFEALRADHDGKESL